MVKIGLVVVSILLISAVTTYSWFNRDSDRVVLTFATAMMLGALGFITKESISNKFQEETKEIPIAVFYGLPEYRPLKVRLPYMHDLMMCIQDIRKEDIPKKGQPVVDIDFGSRIYFDAIQMVIMRTIFERYARGWNVVAKRLQTPNGENISWRTFDDKGEEFQLSHLLKQTSDNYFVRHGICADLHSASGGKAIFPPSTDIKVTSKADFPEWAIELKTKYVSLTLHLVMSSSSVGVGEYSRMLDIPSAMNRISPSNSDGFGNSIFLLETRIEQNYWLNGHPDMKKHRNWADSIVELLDSRLNYAHIREGHLRQFQLYGRDGIISF